MDGVVGAVVVVVGVFMSAPATPIDVTTGVVMAGFGGPLIPARCNAPATDIGLGPGGVPVGVPPGGTPPGGRGLLGGVAIGVGWFVRCTGGVAA